MQALYQTVVVKRELSLKAKLSVYQLGPTLTSGHELSVVKHAQIRNSCDYQCVFIHEFTHSHTRTTSETLDLHWKFQAHRLKVTVAVD